MTSLSQQLTSCMLTCYNIKIGPMWLHNPDLPMPILAKDIFLEYNYFECVCGHMVLFISLNNSKYLKN